MATEAQKLINISLGKIANSRIQRGGMSLHKNLLVASVLQKARTAFMEETFHLMNSYSANDPQSEQEEYRSQDNGNADFNRHVFPPGLTPLMPSTPPGDGDDDKENAVVGATRNQEEESPSMVLVDAEQRQNRNWPSKCLKRRRAVSEVEEAVNSILPKRAKCDGDLLTMTTATTSITTATSTTMTTTDSYCVSCVEETPMDVEQISNLVSIFSSSFNGLLSKNEATSSNNKLSRSLSAPDLCSKQVKDSLEIISMPVLAMTV